MQKDIIYGGVYSIGIEKDGTSYMYIGSSRNLVRRFGENNNKLQRGVHHCSKLQELYNEGLRHHIELLEITNDPQKQINTEAEYIEYFKRIDGIEVLNIIEPYLSCERVYLSVTKVVQVKKLLAQGLTPKEVSEITGVKLQQVYRIKTGNRWGHIEII
jgi:hypothetical protein